MTAGIERSRLPLRDLLSESMAGLLQRPARSVLTMLGTLLGIGSFVAILGITASAGAQIDKRFTALAATEVQVEDAAPTGEIEPRLTFPLDARERLRQIDGVVDGGVYWPLPLRKPSISSVPGLSQQTAGLSLTAVDPGALAAMHPTLRVGRIYDEFHQGHGERVAVLGAAAAQRLGITRLDAHPAVMVNDVPYTVIGIVSNVVRLPELLLGMAIPTSVALKLYGTPVEQPARMLVETRLGAAKVVAEQIPLAVRPDAPHLLRTIAPEDPQRLRGGVGSDLNTLFLLLAGVSLVIGAVGIANTTFVAVIERTAEIGLRRSLGARPRHVASQFLAESGALGTLGGVIGTSLGVAVVIAVALGNSWTAVVNPWTVLPAPLGGTIVGLAAGLYPALRAARIEPVEALRR